ncbi:nucleophile aminohydrolase [Aspergillus ambiguus]|uniref:threonine aspartase 1 n=1 Tax=Aspergillus ambiguus TaxID=176160 RepID=UPI003CCD9165
MPEVQSPLRSLALSSTQTLLELPIPPTLPLSPLYRSVSKSKPTMSRQKNNDVAAIFVHAGAGFHSQHNEKAHLETCENAVRAAMGLLRAGASAVEAVEMAIIVLEDAEITNAGYGSNMTMDGTVECDATIINHLGRSGAAGAVGQVKNPISLARVILDASTKPLSLQRVPPNFLVGPGATEFAYENGLIVLPHDGLVAPASRERWQRWRQELEEAEMKDRQQNPAKYQKAQYLAHYRRPMVTHPAQLLASPLSSRNETSISTPRHVPPSSQSLPGAGRAGSPNSLLASTLQPSPIPSTVANARDGECGDGSALQVSRSNVEDKSETHATASGELGSEARTPSSDSTQEKTPTGSSEMEVDRISDTVGAIAIDSEGNIAAGSSSGGIGMKHRGRIGPAALVGVGTTVIPVDPADPEKTCVATVTSGTGEHIATSMASSVCSSRLYYCQKRCEDGTFEDATEDEAMRSMIKLEFMEHPGVKDSACQAAIGILSVKKTVDGVFLHFGHNTDSFALASMGINDKKPVSVMSRNMGNGSIMQGGRAYRYKRFNLRGTTA